MTNKKFDKFIPLIFVLFFVVLIIVDIILVSLALKSRTGVQTHDHYNKGLNYNKNIEYKKLQDELIFGTKIELKDNNRILYFEINSKDKSLLEEIKIKAKVIRPIGRSLDFEVELNKIFTGQYVGEINFPLEGQWDVKIIAVHDKGVYQEKERFEVYRN